MGRIDIILVVSAAVLLAVLALFLKPSVHADTVAVLSVAGSAQGCCPSCTQSSSLGDCQRCVTRISDSLYGTNGIAWVRKEMGKGGLFVAYDSRTLKPKDISVTISRTGYPSRVESVIPLDEYCSRTVAASTTLLRKSACGGLCGTKEKP